MILAATSWPDAAIAIAGILLVAAVVVATIWQVFGTGRAAVAGSRDHAYRKLAEKATEAQTRTADTLGEVAAELTELRARTTELERMLKEVE